MKKNKIEIDKAYKDLALIMAVNCVQNTVIENYHRGNSPSSKTGDYSDVKVVTPYGEIPWNELSRINDKEMKAFNKEVMDKLYTFLQYTYNPAYEDHHAQFLNVAHSFFPYEGDKPNFDKGLLEQINNE